MMRCHVVHIHHLSKQLFTIVKHDISIMLNHGACVSLIIN